MGLLQGSTLSGERSFRGIIFLMISYGPVNGQSKDRVNFLPSDLAWRNFIIINADFTTPLLLYSPCITLRKVTSVLSIRLNELNFGSIF